MDQDDWHDNDGFRRPSSNGRYNRRPSERKRWIISPWLIGVLLEGIVIAGFAIWVTLLEKEMMAQVDKAHALTKMLADSKAELEALKYDINEEKNMERDGCLPKMLTLRLDEVITINRDYVKSIMFTLSGKRGKKVLEYRVVLQNATPVNIEPKFDIIFFNTMGNRVGAASIGQNIDDDRKREILEKGETRSIDGTYDITDQALPESLMVKVIAEQ